MISSLYLAIFVVLKFYGMRPYKSPEDASGFMGRLINKFRSKSGIRWAISVKGQKKMIGTIGYKYWDTLFRESGNFL